MTWLRWAMVFAVAFVSGLVIDVCWLTATKEFYLSRLQGGRVENGELQPVMWAAIGVYVLLIGGIVFYVLPKLDRTSSFFKTFAVGALFGLTTYGIYDLTNYATLSAWSLEYSAMDMTWGSFLCGIVTVIARFTRDRGAK